MLSNKKLKKVLITIIIAFLLFTIVSFSVTKIIYDKTFPRYDCNITEYPKELENTVALRERKNYYSGENKLSGFLYECQAAEKKDTLIILAPGHNACSDSYLWQIHELVGCGWSVFAFDATGNCNSEGESSLGFSQELLDLKATLEYIKTQNNFDYENIALLGHSQGGYAVCCSLAYDYDVCAVISVSGVNSAMEGVIGASAKHVGPLAYGNYGFLWLYQSFLFGSETVNMRADKILSESNTPALIIHGADDKDYPTNKYSIVSHIDEKQNSNTEIFIRTTPDNSGHTNLLFAKDGTADDEVIEKINDFLNKITQ